MANSNFLGRTNLYQTLPEPENPPTQYTSGIDNPMLRAYAGGNLGGATPSPENNWGGSTAFDYTMTRQNQQNPSGPSLSNLLSNTANQINRPENVNISGRNTTANNQIIPPRNMDTNGQQLPPNITQQRTPINPGLIRSIQQRSTIPNLNGIFPNYTPSSQNNNNITSLGSAVNNRTGATNTPYTPIPTGGPPPNTNNQTLKDLATRNGPEQTNSPFGRSGLDLTNHRLNGNATFFDQPDPSLLRYGHFEAESSGGDSGQTVYRFVPNQNSRITDQGYIRGQNGENLSQVNPNYRNIIDPNKVIYDQEFGFLTDVNNLRSNNSWDEWLPLMLMAPAAAGVVSAAMGGGLGATTGGATAAEMSPGFLSNFSTPAISALNEGALNSAMTGLGYEGWGAAGLGASSGLGGNVTVPPPMGPVEVPPMLPPSSMVGPTLTEGGAGLGLNTAMQIGRTGLGAATALTGGGNGNGRTTTTGGGDGDGNDTEGNGDNWFDNIMNLITGGGNGMNGNNVMSALQQFFNNRNDRGDTQDYERLMNQYMERGDYNSQYRPAYLERLNNLMLNPEKSLDDPTYQSLRQRNLDNLSRSLNARGYGMSGNELGELTQFGREQDYKHINDERSAMMRAASLGHPELMAASGIRSLPQLFQMRANNNAGEAAMWAMLLNGLGLGGGNRSGGNTSGRNRNNTPRIPNFNFDDSEDNTDDNTDNSGGGDNTDDEYHPDFGDDTPPPPDDTDTSDLWDYFGP